jgi:hypothetical protein
MRELKICRDTKLNWGKTKGRGRGVLGGGGWVWWMIRDCLGGTRTPQETPWSPTAKWGKKITLVLTPFNNITAGKFF